MYLAQQKCLVPANPRGIIPSHALTADNRPVLRLNGRQVIVTSYQFQCCGTITAWRTYVSHSGLPHQNGVYSISFQVWRPTTPELVDNGCYIMAGEDRYEKIILPEQPRGLVNRTVPEPSPLNVQPGDVLGFFLTSTMEVTDGIHFNDDEESGFTDEQVWYNTGSLAVNSAACPFPTGPDGVLSGSIRAAPVLSLNIGKCSGNPQIGYSSSSFPLTRFH